MRTCTACHVEKDEHEFYLVAAKQRRVARCKTCYVAAVKKYADANREQVRANNREASAKWREANREREKTRTLAAYHANKGRHAARRKAWAKANPDRRAASENRRRAAKLKATPIWADQERIALLYKEAQEKNQDGQPHHMDHIVPLKSKYVCGLHCEANLQVIPGADNISKGNRYWPDMWQ